MPKHSKRYREAAALVEEDRKYGPADAIDLLKSTASTKFDETI